MADRRPPLTPAEQRELAALQKSREGLKHSLERVSPLDHPRFADELATVEARIAKLGG